MKISKTMLECKNIREFAYLTIKENILTLSLLPGQKITELELVEQLNIGKTPIREALIQLAQESLVNVIPQSGTFISQINLIAAEEAHYVRLLIEEDVYSKVMDCITPKDVNSCVSLLEQHRLLLNEQIQEHWEYDALFHKKLYSICNKNNTFEWLQQIGSDYNRIRVLALLDLPKSHQIIEEHFIILDCIQQKKRKELKQIVHKHLNRILLEKEQLLDKHKNYFIL